MLCAAEAAEENAVNEEALPEVIEEAAEAALEGIGYPLADGEDWQYTDVSLCALVVRDR